MPSGVMPTLPEIVTLAEEARTGERYANHAITTVNDHVVRISVMSEPYVWHYHPDSDETFLVVEGRVLIEFVAGSIELGPGQMCTVPRGLPHRTRPVGARSVNLTVEAASMTTVVEDGEGPTPA